MTATPHQAERRCACGCVLREGHEGGRCECCERKRRAYDPRHDPTFGDRLLALLVANRRKPVNVYAALEIEHCGLAGWRCVCDHVERFRRHGHKILGARNGTYTYLRRNVDRSKARQSAGSKAAWVTRRANAAERVTPRGPRKRQIARASAVR